MGTTNKDIIARLRHTEIFENLNRSSLRHISEVITIVTYHPGDIILEEGEKGDCLYIVTTGLLRVTRSTDRGKTRLGEIHKGGFFGEFTLFNSVERNATIEAVSSSELLRIARKDVVKLFEKNPRLEAHLRKVLEKREKAGGQPIPLSKSKKRESLESFFGDLDKVTLDKLTEEFEWVWLPNSQVLLREGKSGDALYIVLKGQLRVTTTKDDGSETFIGLISPGQLVGEMSLVSDKPHSATVEATSSVELLRLKRDDFDKLLSHHAAIMSRFSEIIQNRISQRVHFEQKITKKDRRPPLTPDICEQILRTDDLVLRNYRITDGYHRLSLDLAEVLGATDLNWPAFGAHASKSAGFTIRKEEFRTSSIFINIIKYSIWRIAPSSMIQLLDDTTEWVSEAISDGNLRIFGDMAPIIARFVEFMRTDSAQYRHNMLSFLGTLKPGPSEENGQDLLGQALLAWYDASQELSPQRTSELMLLGNARMGLHEQIRIQPDIEQALGAPLKNQVGDELSRSIDEWYTFLPTSLKRIIRKYTNKLELVVVKRLSKFIRRIITKRMMKLRLPDYEMTLSEDIPKLNETSIYPSNLKELKEPELIELFARYTDNSSNTIGSGAEDWGQLEDRMNFILHLFRAYQQNHSLYQIPLNEKELDLLHYS